MILTCGIFLVFQRINVWTTNRSQLIIRLFYDDVSVAMVTKRSMKYVMGILKDVWGGMWQEKFAIHSQMRSSMFTVGTGKKYELTRPC